MINLLSQDNNSKPRIINLSFNSSDTLDQEDLKEEIPENLWEAIDKLFDSTGYLELNLRDLLKKKY